MPALRVKPVVAAAALASAIALIGFAGLREGWVYSLDVDEFVAREVAVGQRIRLTGTVGAEDLEVSSAGLLARFFLVGERARLRVEYNGVIPDMFQPGHEVIVEGSMSESGLFVAETLMTKCGSRYESEEDGPAAPHPLPGGTDGGSETLSSGALR